jgi:hypothetical protein
MKKQGGQFGNIKYWLNPGVILCLAITVCVGELL